MKARLLYIEPDSPLRGWAQDVLRESSEDQSVVLMPGSRLGRKPLLTKPIVKRMTLIQKQARPRTAYSSLSHGRPDLFEHLVPKPQPQDSKPHTLLRPNLSLATLLARQTHPAFRISAHKVGLYSKRPSLWTGHRSLPRPISLLKTASSSKLELQAEGLKVTGTNISLRKGHLSMSFGPIEGAERGEI